MLKTRENRPKIREKSFKVIKNNAKDWLKFIKYAENRSKTLEKNWILGKSWLEEIEKKINKMNENLAQNRQKYVKKFKKLINKHEIKLKIMWKFT